MALAQSTQLFYRGMSDDKFVGGQGFVYDCEDVDIRSENVGISLSTTKINANTTIETSEEFISSVIDGYNFVGYKIYSIDINGSPTLSYTKTNTTNRDKYKNAINVGDYKLLVCGSYIDRYGSNFTSMEERYITLDGYCDYRPVLVNGGIAYIGGDSIVEGIDISSTDWINTYSVSVMGKVRAITLIGDTYYIYSNDGSNGYLSSWDGVSNNVSYTQKRTDDPIINVANMGNYDYVICGNNTKRLYLRSGWDKQLLYGSDNIEYDRQLLNFYPEKTNAIETVNNVVYIAGKNCIYTYGTLKAGRYKSLSKIPITDCSEITSIFYVPNGNYIKVGYIDYAEENVKYARISTSISSGEYPNEGFVETLAYTGGDVSIEKQPNRIILTHKINQSYGGTKDTSIDVYARIDTDKYWTFRGVNSLPVIGDIYNDNNVYFTVYSVGDDYFTAIPDKRGIYYTKQFLESNESGGGTLNKTSGSGASSITYDTVDNYIYVGSTGTDINKTTLNFDEIYYYLQLKLVLKTESGTDSPILYSNKVIFSYNNVDNG